MPYFGGIGAISETRLDGEELLIEWQIQNFSSLRKIYSGYYDSPGFDFSNACWRFDLYPLGIDNISFKECVILALIREGVCPPMTIHYAISIKGAEEGKKRKEKKHEFTGYDSTVTFVFPRHEFDNLMPSSMLIFSCKLRIVALNQAGGTLSIQDRLARMNDLLDESSTCTCGRQLLDKQDASINKSVCEDRDSLERQGIEMVVEDLGKLLVSSENSDGIVQVGDTEFSAHKAIISARCPVLSAILQYHSVEKATNEIVIKDLEPDDFKDFLKYLYTGFMESLTQQNVFSIYRVADKYLLGNLKLMCLKLIHETLCVQTFCEAVKLALMHNESDLLKLATEFAIKNISSIVLSVEWQNFICDYPKEANEILIKCLVPQS